MNSDVNLDDSDVLPDCLEDIIGMRTASFVDTVVLVPGLFFMTALLKT